MGTVTTARTITERWTIENGENPGQFGLVSRDPTQPIVVTLVGPAGGETIEIVNVGDSVSFQLRGVQQVIVEAATYPTYALINFTTLPIELDCAPFTTIVQGASTFDAHFDATVSGAATTTIWTPGTGRRFIITGFSISSDVANRVALVDGSDAPGSRIAAPYLAANGGQSGGAYKSQAPGNLLKLVTLGGGHVFLSVDGYESA